MTPITGANTEPTTKDRGQPAPVSAALLDSERDLEAVVPPPQSKAVVLRVMLTALVVLVGMMALEAVKQLTSLDFTFWQMQNDTIVLIALVTTLTAYFALRQYRRVMNELGAWQEKLRDNNARLTNANAQLNQTNLQLAEANARLEEANTSLEAAVEERRLAQSQLVHNACYDSLTKLPNRALFVSRLEQAIARAKRYPDYQFAALFLDLDGFKVVNDSLGHLLGDQMLVEVARRISEDLRATDTCARLGGDEFTILLDNISDISDATRVAERLQNSLAQALSLEAPNGTRHEVFPSASVGITVSRTGYDKTEDVLRDADTAMYRAKASGRGRHEIFDPQMHVQAVRRLQQENDLRRALENREFTVHFQPIVELQSRRIVGFEALSRWASPQRGLVSPGEFIPVAEETGLIVQLDRGALLAACLQMSAWQREYEWARGLTLSVNLSTKHFAQPDVVEQVQRALEVSGMEAHALKLEITESAIMQHPERVTPTLRALHDLHVQVSLDDFGTGYSSLSYLHRFPLDTLKIDRSFISRIGGSSAGATALGATGTGASVQDGNRSGSHNTSESGDIGILQTIVDLARHLKMEVVAEGIETPAQAQCLLELGCRYAQGYLFSRPMSASAVPELFAQVVDHTEHPVSS